MKKLNGLDNINTAVFISGNGSNLKSLVKYSLSKKSKIKIKIVISDNIAAKGLEIAKKNRIKTRFFPFKKKDKSENRLINLLKKNKIELICLAGFMKILSKNFIENFEGKIINIHPSLLPKYKGLNTHQRVIENNEKFSGCSVHWVTPKLDSGKIILQKRLKVAKNDNAQTLAKKILKQEHILYPKAIIKLFTNP